jgi:hypothetical protein
VTNIPLIILGVSLVVALAGVVFWISQLVSRKSACDPSPGKGSSQLGVMYAFTIGMMPWKKESARLHWLVYLRGIAFHIGILAGILVLIISMFALRSPSPFAIVLRILAGLGALSGLSALVQRATDPMLRGISGPDDYIAPALVTVFLLTAALSALGMASTAIFYVSTSVLSLYLPWSKVRHCVHFFFARARIGSMQGHRGLLARPQNHPDKET